MMNEQLVRDTRARLEYVVDVAEKNGSEKAVVVLSAMLATLDFVLEEGPGVSF